ncbi:hypothetical protein QQS21_010129 [Conoideocrella luteorostrata]|uniref:Tetratricopeptide-like helical n=1 Tax=Conoideocrella luteorostrata TaxID=1105319 RepID=A0AAJ0FUH6_9HYPO|nr:hypothetical protein QQS21_010129 [Conoideocrella luteorostrata]
MAARRAPRLCTLTHTHKHITAAISALFPTQSIHHLPAPHDQVRPYASPPSRKAKNPPPYSEVFDLSQIPLSSVESVISRNGDSFQHLSPSEYYAVAQKFAAAIKRGSSPWAISTTGKDAVSADTFHTVACIMRQISSKSADAFATALWSSASEMGYRPSTLSLARQLIRSGAYSRIPQLRKVEARFKQLVAGGKDADALTAEGELLFEQGKHDAAVAMLRRALANKADFEWRPHCELCLGKALMRLGKADEARGLLERLADEGMVEADAELAELARKGGLGVEELEQRLYTGGCNGRRDMFTRLSELALEKGSKKDGEGRLWALEWAKLADSRVEY